MGTFRKIVLTGFLASIFIIASSSKVHAYLVHEVEPGILEMRGVQDGGLEIDDVFVDKSHRWIYFEVKESGLLSRLPSGIADHGRPEVRYFYAPLKEIKLGKAQRLRFLQYGIGKRIYNSRGKIPFGSQRFFYPIVYFQTVS